MKNEASASKQEALQRRWWQHINGLMRWCQMQMLQVELARLAQQGGIILKYAMFRHMLVRAYSQLMVVMLQPAEDNNRPVTPCEERNVLRWVVSIGPQGFPTRS